MDNDPDNLSWIDINSALNIMGDAANTFREKAINYKYTKDKIIDEWYRVCDCGVKPLDIKRDFSAVIGCHWKSQTFENKVTVYTHLHPNHDHIKIECSYCSAPGMVMHIRRYLPYREASKNENE